MRAKIKNAKWLNWHLVSLFANRGLFTLYRCYEFEQFKRWFYSSESLSHSHIIWWKLQYQRWMSFLVVGGVNQRVKLAQNGWVRLSPCWRHYNQPSQHAVFTSRCTTYVIFLTFFNFSSSTDTLERQQCLNLPPPSDAFSCAASSSIS